MSAPVRDYDELGHLLACCWLKELSTYGPETQVTLVTDNRTAARIAAALLEHQP